MNPAPTTIPTFPLARAWGWLGLAAGAGAVVVAVSSFTVSIPGNLPMALSALAVCLFAAAVALEPIRLAARHGFQRVTLVALLTFPIRVALAAVGVVVLVRLTSWPVVPLAMWTLLWYLVFLCVEVAVLVRYLQAATATAAVPACGGAPRVPNALGSHS